METPEAVKEKNVICIPSPRPYGKNYLRSMDIVLRLIGIREEGERARVLHTLMLAGYKSVMFSGLTPSLAKHRDVGRGREHQSQFKGKENRRKKESRNTKEYKIERGKKGAEDKERRKEVKEAARKVVL
mgnify:CR=1 FL=1